MFRHILRNCCVHLWYFKKMFRSRKTRRISVFQVPEGEHLKRIKNMQNIKTRKLCAICEKNKKSSVTLELVRYPMYMWKNGFWKKSCARVIISAWLPKIETHYIKKKRKIWKYTHASYSNTLRCIRVNVEMCQPAHNCLVQEKSNSVGVARKRLADGWVGCQAGKLVIWKKIAIQNGQFYLAHITINPCRQKE